MTIWIFIFIFFFFPVAGYSQTGLTEPFKSPANHYLIDNFNDGNLNFNPEWFQFGDVQLSVIQADSISYQKNIFTKFRMMLSRFIRPKNQSSIKSKFYNALLCEGTTNHWYIGGFGTYLGIDGSHYQSIRFYLYGFGPDLGRLKLELFDDDTMNWKVELDPQFMPLYDDRWIYEITVDWYGWREIEIPFSYFRDDNPNIGDDLWNPNQKNDSGGLIQIQFIILTPPNQEKGKAKFVIDDIEFIRNQKEY